jgi:hypothetical protein
MVRRAAGVNLRVPSAESAFTSYKPMRAGRVLLRFNCFAMLFANWAAADSGRNGLYARFDLTDSSSCPEWQTGFASYPAGQEFFFTTSSHSARTIPPTFELTKAAGATRPAMLPLKGPVLQGMSVTSLTESPPASMLAVVLVVIHPRN